MKKRTRTEKENLRKQCNLILLAIIKHIITENPQLRFGQVLYNLRLVKVGTDPFYDEPYDSLSQLYKTPKIINQELIDTICGDTEVKCAFLDIFSGTKLEDLKNEFS